MTTAHAIPHEEVMAFFDGEVTGARADEIAAHVRTCVACQSLRADVAAVSATLAGWQVGAPPVVSAAPAGRPTRPSLAPIAKLALVSAACVVVLVGGRFAYLRWAAADGVGAGPAQSVAGPDGGRVFRPGDQPSAPLPHGDATTFAAAWLQQPRIDLGVQAGDARVVIVAFMDWLCRACHDFQRAYQPALKKYQDSSPGAVKYVVRDWPWDPGCNRHAAEPGLKGHGASCTAALAVRIARDRGKAEAMIAWLFENLERLAQMTPAEAIEAIKNEVRRLLGIVDFEAAAALVRPGLDQDIADGDTEHVNATPTFFINGVRTNSNGQNLPAEYFDAAIAIELGRSKARGGGSW